MRIDKIQENKAVLSLVSNLKKNPDQINNVLDSDAELINLDRDSVLAITTDTIQEEVKAGLYNSPFTIGWIAVTTSLSDLAAVGAKPIGLVLAVTFTKKNSDNFKQMLYKGISAICNQMGCYILGGDTSSGREFSITSTAVGIIKQRSYMTRKGCKPGDVIYCTGHMGWGNALMLLKQYAPENNELRKFRPLPRISHGIYASQIASAAIDTSDGFYSALDQLARANQCGFRMDITIEKLINPKLVKLYRSMHIPLQMMLAGLHGEFELVFSVPQSKIHEFESSAKQKGIYFLKIGQAIIDSKIISGETGIEIPAGYLRNLYHMQNGNIMKYIWHLYNECRKLSKTQFSIIKTIYLLAAAKRKMKKSNLFSTDNDDRKQAI